MSRNTGTAAERGDAGHEAGHGLVRAVIWLPGLAVALGAAVATAHGLYEVAHAARVPAAIAWLYPLITDGLALVAYIATTRLHASAARYAWSVVVLAAGLSGLAQAAFLAAGTAVEASPGLRFGVGAWPAIAAAIVAHLLYLLATDEPTPRSTTDPTPRSTTDPTPRSTTDPTPLPGDSVPTAPFSRAPVQTGPITVQSVPAGSVQSASPTPVQHRAAVPAPTGPPALAPAPIERPDRRSGGTPARDRARAAATRHAHRHGALPTVTELEAAAGVSRGTAAAVLKHLRTQPPALHLITRSPGEVINPEQTDDPTHQENTPP